MSLRDALKRAAGLVIEFPPEEEAASTSSTSNEKSSATDRMWDDLEQSTKPAATVESATPNDISNDAPNVSETPSVSAAPIARARTVEQIVRDAAGPNLDQISVTGADLPDLFGPDSEPHFAPIYTRAALPPVSYSAEQMLEMLTSLPTELDLETRRRTVIAMLKGMGAALGASPESIVADASRKLAALAAYVDCCSSRGDDHVRTCQQEIQAFETQIADRRKSIQAEQERQTKVTEACTDQAKQLHQVLEFFSTAASKTSQS